jgi:hypothetical protein
MKPRISALVALPGALALCACVAVPQNSAPSVVAGPGTGKSWDQFQADDGSCRQYAQQQIGNTTPGKAAQDSAVGSAAVGTLLGAAAGALIGAGAHNPGAGAAIGAGTGLAVGSAVGANNAQVAGATVQQHYDSAYVQCITGKGDKIVQGTPAPYYRYPAPPPPGYYYPPPPPPPPPY